MELGQTIIVTVTPLRGTPAKNAYLPTMGMSRQGKAWQRPIAMRMQSFGPAFRVVLQGDNETTSWDTGIGGSTIEMVEPGIC